MILKSEFEVLKNQSLMGTGYYSAQLKNGNSIYVCYSPTSNCQIYSIASLNNLITPGYSFDKEYQINVLKEVQKVGRKLMVMLDINDKYVDILESIWPKDMIISKILYKSTRNSDMVFYLAKTQWLIDLNIADHKAKLDEAKKVLSDKVELPF